MAFFVFAARLFLEVLRVFSAERALAAEAIESIWDMGVEAFCGGLGGIVLGFLFCGGFCVERAVDLWSIVHISP